MENTNLFEHKPMTVREVAKHYGVSKRTVLRWADSGILRTFKDPDATNRLLVDPRLTRHNMETRFLTTRQAARLYDVNVRTIRSWISKGQLNALNIGENRTRWLVREVL